MALANLRMGNVGPSLPFTPDIRSRVSFATKGDLSVTLDALTLVAFGSGPNVGYINRNVGPSLPFKPTLRGFASAATAGSVSITLDSLLLTSDATVGQPASIGRPIPSQWGPALDFTPTIRGYLNPPATVGTLGITLGDVTLVSTATATGIIGTLSAVLGPLTLGASASVTGLVAIDPALELYEVSRGTIVLFWRVTDSSGFTSNVYLNDVIYQTIPGTTITISGLLVDTGYRVKVQVNSPQPVQSKTIVYSYSTSTGGSTTSMRRLKPFPSTQLP